LFIIIIPPAHPFVNTKLVVLTAGSEHKINLHFTCCSANEHILQNFSQNILFYYKLCYNIFDYRLWQKGGVRMILLSTIAATIVGNVASYYIIKWLDSRNRR